MFSAESYSVFKRIWPFWLPSPVLHFSSGYGKLASMPAGGAVAVASSAGAGSGGAAAPAAGEHFSLAPCLSASVSLGTNNKIYKHMLPS